MTKYLIIGLALLLVSALAYGFWERGRAIAADAHSTELSAQLTQAQSDLIIARSSVKIGGEQSLKLDTDLQVNFTDQLNFTVAQAQLEKKDVTVASYLATPVPPALVCLLDDEDKAYLPSHPAAGKPTCDVPPANPPVKSNH